MVIALAITYNDSFQTYHTGNKQYAQETQQALAQIDDLDIISYPHPSVDLYQTPDLELLDAFVDLIESAEESIRIQVYIFTEKRIRSALIDAHRRGVDVQVLLEPFVYGAPSINKTTFNLLDQAGIPVSYTSESNYTFTHTKMLLVDDIYIIGTGNLSYSSFRHNQEFFAVGNDPEIYQTLLTMWEKDQKHLPHSPSHPSLVFSPLGAREKITTLIDAAESSLEIYAQSLSDIQIKNLLKQKHDQWIDITISMGNLEKYPANEDDIQELRDHGIYIETPDKPYVHAKAIFVDGKIGYIGSINFTQNSIENNREVGILFSTN